MSHIEHGIPVERLDLSARNKQRVVRCMDLYYRWIANPNLNPKAMLRELWPTLSRYDVQQDYKVFLFIIEQLEQPNRRMDELRARHNIETMVSIGEALGDWKPLDKATKHLIEVGHLNQPETHGDDVRNTAMLPPVLVNIEAIDPERKSISNEMMNRLARKYGGVLDEHQQLIEAKEQAIWAESEAAEPEHYSVDGNVGSEPTYEEEEYQWDD